MNSSLDTIALTPMQPQWTWAQKERFTLQLDGGHSCNTLWDEGQGIGLGGGKPFCTVGGTAIR